MKNKKVYILYTILLIVLSIFIVPIVFQNDTFFTIANGEKILQYGVDNIDHLTYHNIKFYEVRYLFDIIIFLINKYFGFNGIHIFTILMTISTSLILFNGLNSLTKNIHVSFLASFFNITVLLNYATARSQIVSYQLFFLEVLFIIKYLKEKKNIYLLYFFIISVLISNIHGSAYMFLYVLLLPFLAESILSLFLKKEKYGNVIVSKSNTKEVFKVLFVLLIGGFLTPAFPQNFLFFFKVNGVSVSMIGELQPVNILRDSHYILFIIIPTFYILYFKEDINLSNIFLIYGLICMGIMYKRNKMIMIIVGLIMITQMIYKLLLKYKIVDLIKKMMKRKIFKYGYYIIVIAFSLINILFNYRLNLEDNYDDGFPKDATNYISSNYDRYKDKRIYNEFNYGSYLEYKGIKTFIDSRSEIFEKSNGNTILSDFYDVSLGRINYRDLFSKYKINYALITNSSIISKYIKYDNDYKQVYFDDAYSIYEKVVDFNE